MKAAFVRTMMNIRMKDGDNVTIPIESWTNFSEANELRVIIPAEYIDTFSILDKYYMIKEEEDVH